MSVTTVKKNLRLLIAMLSTVIAVKIMLSIVLAAMKEYPPTHLILVYNASAKKRMATSLQVPIDESENLHSLHYQALQDYNKLQVENI